MTVGTIFHDNALFVEIFQSEPKLSTSWRIHPLGTINKRFHDKTSNSCWEELSLCLNRSHKYYGCWRALLLVWHNVNLLKGLSCFSLGSSPKGFILVLRKMHHTQHVCFFVIIDIDSQGEAWLKVVTAYLQGRKCREWLLLHCHKSIVGGNIKFNCTPILSYLGWMCMLWIKYS